MTFRGLVYELATGNVSRDVVGRKVVLSAMDSGHSMTRGVCLETSICVEGRTGIVMSSSDLCLLGSLSSQRILKVIFYVCVHIKRNIIQAGFIITYSLLF